LLYIDLTNLTPSFAAYFFLNFVTISPEIKIHNGLTDIHDRDPDLKYSNVLGGLTDIHDRDPDLKYSNVLGRLSSRMIVFSITIEP